MGSENDGVLKIGDRVVIIEGKRVVAKGRIVSHLLGKYTVQVSNLMIGWRERVSIGSLVIAQESDVFRDLY